MSIAGKVIDSVLVDPAQCKNQDYLHALRRLLYARHQLSIAALQREPMFYIEVPSVMEVVDGKVASQSHLPGS